MYFEVNDANEYYEVALKALREKGSATTVRENKTIEIINPTFVVNNPTLRVNTERNRKWPRKGFTAEFLWYASGNRNVKTIEKYLPAWRKFADENGNVNSNYGYYWHPNIANIVRILKDDPSARHACFSIYDSKYSTYTTKDVPCTFSGQFLIRDDKLNLIVFNRSRDCIKGELGGDFYCFSILLELVANELQIPVGKYISMIGSLHIYEPDFEKMFTQCSFETVHYPKQIILNYFDFFKNLSYYSKTQPDNSDFLSTWSAQRIAQYIGQKTSQYAINDYMVSTVIEKQINVMEFYNDYATNNYKRTISSELEEHEYF